MADMTEAEILKWKAVVYLVSTAIALTMIVAWRDRPLYLWLLPSFGVVGFGGMAAYLVFIKGARWRTDRGA